MQGYISGGPRIGHGCAAWTTENQARTLSMRPYKDMELGFLGMLVRSLRVLFRPCGFVHLHLAQV